MTGKITFGGTLLSELSDDELSEKINTNVKISGKNKLQSHIIDLWVQILRVFDDVGTDVTVRQMFYEIDIHALKYHLDNCMKDMDPGDYGT